MTVWKPIREELSVWKQEGLSLPIWWRDDDAVEPTPQLETLAALSREFNLPVHLAVIPNHAQPALAEMISKSSNLLPVMHGFAHENHAFRKQKKAEFGRRRMGAKAELASGFAKLDVLFGDRFLPLFVPPWNRITTAFYPTLQSLGICGVSGFTPRDSAIVSGLQQINTHIDPIDWHATRSAHPREFLVQEILKNLQDRRLGKTDNAEPLGMLTHHLVHDPAIWDFTRACLETLLAGPVTRWTADTLKGQET